MIQVEHLTKSYGGHLAVDDLSFEVQEGKIYGLLGPNGAGKSTTMNIITGYLSATEGRVLVGGHDIREEPEAAKACIGYLPEVPPLYTDMTVLEYLLFVAELKGVKKKAERLEQCQAAMARAGLQEVERRLIKNLSKGYRQRVGIAAALLGSPSVIILDEPTVGLDPAQMIEIRQLIRDLGKTHTVILSSHILSEVQAVCDQVLIIANGRLAAQGTPEELAGQLMSKSVLTVTALGNAQAARAALADMAGLTKLEVTDERNGEVSLALEGEPGTDLRAAVSALLATAGCPVLSMNTQTMTLEQVFLQLTETEADGAAEDTEDTEEPSAGPDAAEAPDTTEPAAEPEGVGEPPAPTAEPEDGQGEEE